MNNENASIPSKALFTPGPVAIDEHILALGATQLPYHRTGDFSRFMREILEGLRNVFQTRSQVTVITGSGTASMEAAVLNFLDRTDRVLIVNGGTFGQRWCDLCRVHSVSFEEYELKPGDDIDSNRLAEILSQSRFTALLINAHETSTGHLYDIESIGKIASRFDLLYVVDAISTICADRFAMDDWHVDVAILSSQKALALPPGLSFIAMSPRALSRLSTITPRTLYLNIRDCLRDQERGQLPYTPAIGLFVQLHQRLLDIRRITLPEVIHQHERKAVAFRKAISDLPFRVLPDRQSNALTALLCEGTDARNIVEQLRMEFDIEVTPSGGELKDKLIRVAHMGNQDETDRMRLISALREITLVGSLVHERNAQ